MNLKFKYYFLFIGVIFVLGTITYFKISLEEASPAIASVDPDPSFTADNLLFDADFINTGAMTSSEIQAFLESKNSILATIDPKRLCGTTVEECDNTKSAAEIIYEAAILTDSEGNPIGVNPAVILVTLQKEQSLITKTSWLDNCNAGSDCPVGTLQYALDWAMGYYMTNPELKGFRQQLLGVQGSWWGASQSMRNNYDYGRGPNVDSLCHAYGDEPKTPSYFEGNCWEFEVTNTTSYYNVPEKQWVKPENKSTMALYRYTPHVFNGNYNFWYYWNYWFGSIYNVKINSNLSLNTYSVVEGNLLIAKFSIKNHNKISMNLSRLKVDIRGTGNPQDIYGLSHITLSPGQLISFPSPYNEKIITNTGSYTAKIWMQYRNKWYSPPPSWAQSQSLTVRAIKSTDLYLSPALSLSPNPLYTGETVTGTFTIYNKTNAPIFLQRLKVDIRDSTKAYDLLGYSDKTLTNSLVFSQNNSRVINKVGTYNAGVRVKVNGKWLIPDGDVERTIEVKFKIEALRLTAQLRLNTTSFIEGNILRANFVLKNLSTMSNISLQRLKIDVRGTGKPQDIYGISDITLSPGETLYFSSPPEGITVNNTRVLTDTGSYTARIWMKYKDKWYSPLPSWAQSEELTIKKIQPTDLYLNPSLSLTPSSLYTGETVTGTFTIYNKTNAPIFLQRLKVDIRDGTKAYDLLGHSNETLTDSIIFSKNNSRTINEAGTYKAGVRVKVNGKWLIPSGNIEKTLEVKSL